jgi:hypothetical protein
MADRFLKHVPSGVVYIYAPPWIDNPDFVEVANAKGDPLKEPEPIVNISSKRKAKTTAEPVQEILTELDLANAGLSADASRGL